MVGHRRNDTPGPWRGLLASLLLGAALAALVMVWLGNRASPAIAPAYDAADAETAGQRSVGFELVLRFRVLLPDRAAKGAT